MIVAGLRLSPTVRPPGRLLAAGVAVRRRRVARAGEPLLLHELRDDRLHRLGRLRDNPVFISRSLSAHTIALVMNRGLLDSMQNGDAQRGRAGRKKFRPGGKKCRPPALLLFCFPLA